MITRAHLAGVWCGYGFLTLFFIGFWPLAHFLPGQSPSLTAQQIATMYQNNANGIRFGMLLLLFGAMCYLPYSVSLAAVVRRIENGGDFFATTILVGACTGAMFLFLPALFWEVTAFRPDRPADLILLMNDTGWIMLITAVPPFILQSIPVGFAILMDKSETPIFPRWFAYITLWLELTYLPGDFAFFFKSGPAAWNGLLPYWLPFITYGTWINITCILMFRAIPRLSQTPS